MRKVEVSVYKFDELSEEVKEALIEGSASVGIRDSIEDMIESKLAGYGLKSLIIDDFSIGDDDQDDFITLSGALSDNLRQWENDEDFEEYIDSIKFCLLDEEDVDEDSNPFGISLGGDDMTEEDQEAARSFIDEKLTDIVDKIISDVREAMDVEDSFDVDEAKVMEYLRGFEYFVDGTAFDADEHVK